MTRVYRIGLTPRGASRPRAARGGGRVYMPPEHRAWMEAATVMLREQSYGEPQRGAVAVRIVATWPTPKARPSWCPREVWAGRAAGLWMASKPDADNVGKIVLDAMVAAGLLEDDRGVVSLAIEKRMMPGAGGVDAYVMQAPGWLF